MEQGASSEQGQRKMSLGDVVFQAAERSLQGPSGRVTVEPLVAQVLDLLGSAAGTSISRNAIFAHCWGSPDAGDDSLNRTIYQLRRALVRAGSTAVTIETLAAQGYVLKIEQTPLENVCVAARRSWRQGFARADHQTIAALRSALAQQASGTAEAWGLLALHLCRAAEYEPIEKCAQIVADCEEAAREALALDPGQPDARVALSSLRPLFGDWSGARLRLVKVLADAPTHFPARHELAVLEMATGRVSAAVPLIEGLLDEDPLAATLHYKRGYHLYCLGEHDKMDRVLDNALQTWPGHPGLWQCRTMTLAFTGRAAAALALLDDGALRPPMPEDSLEFHRMALRALLGDHAVSAEQTADTLFERAGWQSLAVAGIMYLCALGRDDLALKVCEKYYLRDGQSPMRLVHEPTKEASINEMHRRATQPLFLPVTARLRALSGFVETCARIGLAEYWRDNSLQPDFMAGS